MKPFHDSLIPAHIPCQNNQTLYSQQFKYLCQAMDLLIFLFIQWVSCLIIDCAYFFLSLRIEIPPTPTFKIVLFFIVDKNYPFLLSLIFDGQPNAFNMWTCEFCALFIMKPYLYCQAYSLIEENGEQGHIKSFHSLIFGIEPRAS